VAQLTLDETKMVRLSTNHFLSRAFSSR